MRNVLLFALAVTTLAACSKPVDVVGKWTGKMDLGEISKSDKPEDQFGKKFAQGLADSFKVDLELKADKTFDMNLIFMPIEGTYTVSGSELTLTPTKVMGVAVEELKKRTDSAGKPMTAEQQSELSQEMKCALSQDGKSFTVVTKQGGKDSKLIFTRNEAK